MADIWKDFVKQTVSAVASSGTGAFTLSSASSGFQALAAGDDGKTGYFAATEGATWQTFWGTYTHSGTSLARTTPIDGSSGAATNVTFTAAAVVYLDAVSTISASASRGRFGVLGNATAVIAVTSAVTATLDRWHLCTGTSANYTVTLPPVSGNAGHWLGFVMGGAAALTKLVTLDGNASETIDGTLTRIMWAGETCELYCDGSNWFKVAGRSIPMMCTMYRNAAVAAFANAAVTKVSIDATLKDNSGLMASTGSSLITVQRPSVYRLNAVISMTTTALASNVQSRIHLNGDTANAIAGSVANTSSSAGIIGIPANLENSYAAGDTFELYGFQNQGSTLALIVGSAPVSTLLTVSEIVQW